MSEKYREERRARLLRNAESRMQRIRNLAHQEGKVENLDDVDGVDPIVLPVAQPFEYSGSTNIDSLLATGNKQTNTMIEEQSDTSRMMPLNNVTRQFPQSVNSHSQLVRFCIICAIAVFVQVVNFVLEYSESLWHIDRIFLPLLTFLLIDYVAYPPKSLRSTHVLMLFIRHKSGAMASRVIAVMNYVLHDVSVYLFANLTLWLIQSFVLGT